MKLPALFKALIGGNSPQPEPETGERLSAWRNGRIKKQFTLHSTGPGFVDPFEGPPPETTELPEGWFIDDNGHYTCRFPAVELIRDDFVQGELEAYPAYLKSARMTDSTSWSRFKMNAYWVGLHFHHWMGKNVPGFWDVYNYKRSEDNDKVFRLSFEGQGKIVFYGTHGGYSGRHAKRDEEGATLVVKTSDGKVFRLLYESSIANPHRDICYPGEQNVPHVGFNLPPSGVIADNIITAYAIVRAAGRLAADQKLKPLPAPENQACLPAPVRQLIGPS